MDCVLTAYKAHLYYMGISPNNIDEKLYRLIKSNTHELPAYTFGGVAPIMLATMGFLGHGLSVEVQHSIWTKEHYLSFAEKEDMLPMMKFCIKIGNFGKNVQKITLKPAIYMMYDMAHAIFLEEVPAGIPVMAIKIIDKLERSKVYDRHAACIA